MNSKALAQPPPPRERIHAALERAHRGDAAAIAEARQILTDEPALWDGIGELAQLALGAWIKTVIGDDPISNEGVRRHLRALRQDLGGEMASPLERLLISRVQVTWLQVYSAEILYAQNTGQMSFAQHDFHQRRITQSQKRHLAAIRTLATVHRLLTPAVPSLRFARVDQVNVATEGGQQVNATVSAGGGSDALEPPG